MRMLLAPIAVLATAAAACASAAGGADEVSAVAGAYPLSWVAEEIAPEAQLVRLGSRGIDPHDLELTPSEQAAVQRADVALHVGDIGFMPEAERAIARSAAVVVDAVDVAGPERLISLDPAEAEGHDDEAHDDEAHDDDEEDLRVDPHVWFDADVMADVAIRAGDAFAEADPDGADGYRERAAEVSDRLRALADEIDGALTGCRSDTAIVSHEAYAYLLVPRGLRQEGMSGAGGHGEATPQRLAELVRRIESEGIPAVLAEPVEGREGAEAVAAEAGVPLVEIYSLDLVTEEQAEIGYPDLLRAQAESVAQALGCG